MNQSIFRAYSTVLNPHPIIKEAGIMEHTTSNAARLRRDTAYGDIYRGVNDVFTPDGTGHNW